MQRLALTVSLLALLSACASSGPMAPMTMAMSVVFLPVT